MRKLLSSAVLISFILILTACGGGSGDRAAALGGITATAVWPGGAISAKGGVMRKAPPEVRWVRMIVSKGTTTLSADYDALVVNSGSISGVPAGTGWTLTFAGLNTARTIVYYEGSKGGITVTAGQTTNAGSVTMRVMPEMSGMLDTTFNTTGTLISNNLDAVTSLAVQSDGKIVAAGGSGTAFRLARYTTSGSLDPGFGTAGLYSNVVGSGGSYKAVAVLNDGRIVAAGDANSIAPGSPHFVLNKLWPDGTPDSAFGNNGLVTGTRNSSTATSLGILPGGDIVVGGYTFNGTNNDFALDIYSESTGSLVSSVTASFSCLGAPALCNEAINAIAVQSDGKIVAAGEYQSGPGTIVFGIMRFLPNGNLDSSFGTGGKTELGGPVTACRANAVALQSNGKIVTAGYCSDGTGFAVARFLPNGSRDMTFNGGNMLIITLQGTVCRAAAIRVQPDGKIIVAGSSGTPASPAYTRFAVARLHSDGTIDTSFNPAGPISGTVITTLGTINDDINTFAIQADGKIIAGGRSYVSPGTQSGIARYWNDVTTKETGYLTSGDGMLYEFSTTSYAVSNVISLATTSAVVPAVDPKRNRVYVSDASNNALLVVDTINKRVIQSISVGTAPVGVLLNADANRLYVANSGSNTVTVIDTSDNSLVTTIDVGSGPRGLSLNTGTNRLYVSNSAANSISTIDTLSNTVVGTITGGGLNDPRLSAVDAANGRLLVPNYGNTTGNTVSIFNTANNAFLTSLTVNSQPIRIVLNPTTGKAYVGHGTGNSVTIIRPDNSMSTFLAGSGPRGVALDPGLNRLFVANANDNTVSFHDISTDSGIVITAVPMGVSPNMIGIAP